MDRFFCKIGLVKSVNVVSKTSKAIILERLKDIMDIPFHVHQRKAKRFFEGEVSNNEFSFRRKKGFLGIDQDSETLVKVLGTIREREGEVIISAGVVGQRRELFMASTIAGGLLVMISVFLQMESFRGDIILSLIGVLIVFLLHRYSKLRKGVSKMTRTVDLELKNLARQDDTPNKA